MGRTLLQVFQQEFPYQPQQYFPRAIAAGRLVAHSRRGDKVGAHRTPLLPLAQPLR